MKIKELVRAMIDEELPDNAVIFLEYKTFLEVFTKKRLELIEVINQKQPQTLQELADLVQRKKQAVHRDLKILEGHNIVKVTKKGKTAKPVVARDAIIMNLKNEKEKIGVLAV